MAGNLERENDILSESKDFIHGKTKKISFLKNYSFIRGGLVDNLKLRKRFGRGSLRTFCYLF